MTDDEDHDGDSRPETEADERETPLSDLADRVTSTETGAESDQSEMSTRADDATDEVFRWADESPEATGDADPSFQDLADDTEDLSDDAVAELFEQEGVAEIDRDELWDTLEDDTGARSQEPDSNRIQETDTHPDRQAEREIRVVSKRTYCHQCDHFETPPNVGCMNEGTDILELVRLDQFRVADCPVVLEDEQLEG